MAKVQVSAVVPAAVEHVWEYVHDFAGLSKWFPGLTDIHIEPGVANNQAGCIRNLVLENGARIREQLLAISDQDRSWSYKMVESPLPVTNYVATVRLSSSDGNGTLAEIASQFDVAATQEKEIVNLLTATYQGAFELLKKHFHQA
jgi:hypothetical protein